MKIDREMEECLNYFRSKAIFQKLFDKFREKYISLGHFGGNVTFYNLKIEEQLQLEGFLQRECRSKTVTVSANMLKKSLSESKFENLRWEDILTCYYGEPLTSKQETKQKKEIEKMAFLEQLTKEVESPAATWLQEVIEKKRTGFQILTKQYNEDKKALQESIHIIMKAAQQLPILHNSYEKLPVFAARITGNPHALDDGTLNRRLLDLFLESKIDKNKSQLEELNGVEWKTNLLYQAGLLKDDLSNDTLVYGIMAQRKDGTQHLGIEGFYKIQEPFKITLLTLSSLSNTYAQKKVYVLENPAVFSELILRYPNISSVCVNGQPRLASLVLLDFLSKNSELWYAGDFDPEGLIIAQNLKKRFGEHLTFWDYKKEYYEQTISNVILSENRLKKLNKIEEEGLIEIKTAILEKKRAAYQEKILTVGYQIEDS